MADEGENDINLLKIVIKVYKIPRSKNLCKKIFWLKHTLV